MLVKKALQLFFLIPILKYLQTLCWVFFFFFANYVHSVFDSQIKINVWHAMHRQELAKKKKIANSLRSSLKRGDEKKKNVCRPQFLQITANPFNFRFKELANLDGGKKSIITFGIDCKWDSGFECTFWLGISAHTQQKKKVEIGNDFS